MLKISKAELARRLEERVECAYGGEQGLATLIHGWLKYRKYGKKYYFALHKRNFLYVTEVQELSEYAGVDLTQ